jgi:hypothetical protein
VESILGPLGTSATEWPIVPAPGDCDDGAIGGIKIGKGNRSTRRNPAPAPLCPPQITLDQTRARTRAAAVGSQRLTALAMARRHLQHFSDGILARRPGFDSLYWQIFLYSTASGPDLRHTEPPIYWAPVPVSQGKKWPGREADNSPISIPVWRRGRIPSP